MQNCNSKFKSDLIDRCYKFSLKIISITDSLPNKISSKIITSQIIRSSTSIAANLIEGKASSSRLEFKKFYEISLKSANETKYWLCLSRDAKLLNENIIEPLLQEVDEISRMLASGVLKLKNKRF